MDVVEFHRKAGEIFYGKCKSICDPREEIIEALREECRTREEKQTHNQKMLSYMRKVLDDDFVHRVRLVWKDDSELKGQELLEEREKILKEINVRLEKEDGWKYERDRWIA